MKHRIIYLYEPRSSAEQKSIKAQLNHYRRLDKVKTAIAKGQKSLIIWTVDSGLNVCLIAYGLKYRNYDFGWLKFTIVYFG